MGEPGPLEALLAQHKDTQTILDIHFNSNQRQIAKPPAEIQKTDIAPKQASDSEDDTPIGLSYRHPSYASLKGSLITKGGDLVQDLQLDFPSETPTTIEIDLTKEAKDHNSDGTKDEDPQIAFIKELQEKNKTRWEKMGYVPPTDLNPLTRARSNAVFCSSELNPAAVPIPTHSSAANIPPIPLPALAEIALPVVEETPKVNRLKRKRSASFGMKLGQSDQSLELILKPSHQLHEEEDEEEIIDDFGRLPTLIGEEQSSPLYQLVFSRRLPKEKDINSVLTSLKKLYDECSNRLYVDEAEYIYELIEEIKKAKEFKTTGEGSFESQREAAKEAYEKQMNKIEKVKGGEEYDQMAKKIETEFLDEIKKIDLREGASFQTKGQMPRFHSTVSSRSREQRLLPQLLDRRNDIEILERMTKELLEGRTR